MSMNNSSREIFNNFIAANPQYKREMNRNVFIRGGVKYAFSVSTSGKAECRQFYEDCDHLLTLDYRTMKVYDIPREELNIHSSPNRITGSGLKAFTAKGDFDQDFESNIKVV